MNITEIQDDCAKSLEKVYTIFSVNIYAIFSVNVYAIQADVYMSIIKRALEESKPLQEKYIQKIKDAKVRSS